MADSHAASPNSEVSGTVSAAQQNATSTAPSQLKRLENGATPPPDSSNDTKIVRSSPGV